tara:strand:+ start:653 stop:1462 length:810 start_codon:yes stop_codon:yes gene_type:complete
MINLIKYSLVRLIELSPSIHSVIYKYIHNFTFLFPHEKDYLGLNLIFKKKINGDILDIGGNIGLSTIGFRSLGFKKNKIFIFEPNFECLKKLRHVQRRFGNIEILNYGLSSIDIEKTLYTPMFKEKSYNFLSSFEKKYVKKKLIMNYGKQSKNFKLKKEKIILKKFDNIKKKIKPIFIKIDVEGHDHKVINGMMETIKKFKPVILVEYNQDNFGKIFNKLNKFYNFYYFNFIQNKMEIIHTNYIKKIIKNNLQRGFFLSERNIFLIKKP